VTDVSPLSVTVDQAATQADPATFSPIHFTGHIQRARNRI